MDELTEEQVAALRAKKVNVRRAHRASATRFINQIDRAIDIKDTCKLKQLKQSLTEKLTVLMKLDDELIELVEGEELGNEVEQADEVRERIDLAVITIENVLVAERKRTSVRHRSDSSSSASDGEDIMSQASDSHLATTTSVPITPTGVDSVPVTLAPPTRVDSVTLAQPVSVVSVPVTSTQPVGVRFSLPSVTTTQSTLPLSSTTVASSTLSHSMRMPTMTSFQGMPLLSDTPVRPVVSAPAAMTIPPSTGLIPATYYRPTGVPSTTSVSAPIYSVHRAAPVTGVATTYYGVPMMPHIAGATPSHYLSPVVPATSPLPFAHTAGPQVKLPKLSIKKFSGDLTRWVTFWDSFNSSIHSNPSLSSVDKFNYLMSLVESSAAEAIAGLTITSANYDEAIATLQKRFGNPQLIVNRHMEALLGITAVSSQFDIKGLRKLYDTVEAHVRGLRALGVPAESYGSLLTSVLVNKLPSEIRLIVSRGMTTGSWDLDGVMKILEQEVEARERTSTAGGAVPSRKTQPRTPTGATLLTDSSGSSREGPTCVYCGKCHTSTSCTNITDVAVRKNILRKAGRCYSCLRKNHLSKDCRSGYSCRICRGRHHVTICTRRSSTQGSQSSSDSREKEATPHEDPPNQGGISTSTMYTGAQTPILLQTAKMQLLNLESEAPCLSARAVMDSGSQRTYVTSHLRDQLNLSTIGTESLRIKTFGATETQDATCDLVELGVRVEGGEVLKLSALVVPFICNPVTTQPINHSKQSYDHLIGLKLADSAEVSDTLEIDVLIGSDFYWNLVTGQVVRGNSGPTAIHTKVGWILSGPTTPLEVSVNLTVTSAHTLKIETCCSMEPTMEDYLKRFWDLESLGIIKEETPVYEKFVQKIKFDGHKYKVYLPWKEYHPPLPDHQELCRRRLMGLLRRLRQTPQLLMEYNAIIQDQLKKGIVEVVPQPSYSSSDRTHYLPHHGVVRQDKATSKLRIVYDASARSTGPSLNECLYTGPKFGQSIFDILLRFRLQQVALAGDIEKAFLMLSMHEGDRDSLRFLWVKDPRAEPPEIITLRFTRVVFGVTASPFLLNATIKHHMDTYRQMDPQFVEKFLSSIYVDDIVSGSKDVETTYEFYQKSSQRLAVAGFRLRKFVTNSEELRYRIQLNEPQIGEEEIQPSDSAPVVTAVNGGDSLTHAEEDQSYAKISLGIKVDEEPGVHKILGIEWNTNSDSFQFDIGGVATTMEGLEPTKRSVVKTVAKFFDPLGIVSPVTILFKMFAQQLCEAKVNWDEPLSGNLLKQWEYLLSMLREAKSIVIPRYLYSGTIHPIQHVQLVGFCDASVKAYAAMVYLKLKDEAHKTSIKLVATKTRVAPVGETTIPRLELLSALLLSKLIDNVHNALELELQLGDPVCFSDSRVVLYWIQGVSHEWKQFVENRVNTIRSLVAPQHWRHCPGKENPADIPSRGMSASELADTPLWLHGPDWLYSIEELQEEPAPLSVPEECRREMRRKDSAHSLVTHQDHNPYGVSQIINPEQYSSSYRLFRVTELVLKFIRCLCSRVSNATTDAVISAPTMSDFSRAKLLWIKDCQSGLQDNSQFPLWKHHLNLFTDKFGIWRCGGRMSKSCLPTAAQNPILLDKNHHLAKLIVADAHLRVIHNGVRETLAELRSEYWLVKGRQFIRKLIHSCVVCKKQEGKPCHGNPPPPLPEYRVQQSRPFQTTGVDFAGPLFVRTFNHSEGTSKVWLCLYTCCSTRAVHLDLIPDMTATTFLKCFRRFTARRGTPSRMISDNAKTFKSASKTIKQVLESPEAKKYFSQTQVEWNFNLEKAPWWGGIFERMIKSAKRCLKKSIGKNCLSHDDLLTLVTEVEAVLNSRPLTYISSEDVEEPLTPSHLLVGYRILTLPDPSIPDDQDYSPEGLTRRMSHLSRTLQHFWNRWKREYLSELREFHYTHREKGGLTVKEGDVVTVYDEGHPRGLWRLGRIEGLVHGVDGVVRGVHVRVMSKKGHLKTLRRPLQHIYPLEVHSDIDDGGPIHAQTGQDMTRTDSGTSDLPTPNASSCSTSKRPIRRAATHARDKILGCVIED